MTTTINKDALVAQVQTIVSNLNLSTNSSTRLALFYKVAENVNSTSINVQTELLSRLETVSSSESLEELLMLIVATSLITDDRSVTVSDLTALNALTNVETGSIYFVEDIETPYIKKINGSWVPVHPSANPLSFENLYAWGRNNDGRLGDGTTIDRSSLVSVVGGFTDWVSASGGVDHSLGVRANGTLWAWGDNIDGQLGDGTETNRSSPVSVVGGFTDWVSASAGAYHSLGIRANGTLWAWGRNAFGQLGDGATDRRSSPVSVVGGFTDWVSVSTGGYHNLGIRANGTLWAWGNNYSGQLGDGTTINRSSPVSVVGGFADWVSASGGYVHSLGIRSNGSLWSWGRNAFGQLGDDTTTDRSSPVSVVGGFTDWVSASSGTFNHSLGIRSNGTLWSWGRNAFGRLGDGTTINRSSPGLVVGGFTDWVSVSAGYGHNLGVRANGTLWSWGNNYSGQLGDGTTTNLSSPVSVVGGFADWVSASAGSIHSLGLRTA